MPDKLITAPRVYISAAHKSSGKTTLSIGMCAAFNQQGLVVQPFKKGPDYIDPLWLTQASGGRACHNLDFNTMNNDEILQDFSHYSQGADVNLIEGNLGLYDGVALDGSDSNAGVVKLIKSPVILVINSQGVTRGVAPLLMGYQQFDPDIQIAGVIYNLSAGGRHEQKLRAVTEEYTDIPVLGVVKRNVLMEVDERHLGLKPSNEGGADEAEKKIALIAQLVTEQIDLSKVLDIAKSAPEIAPPKPLQSEINSEPRSKIRLGICEDSAFGFYYAGDKLALERAGADLVPINTLQDEKLPDDIDGLFIGGGFPETHMQALADNTSMRESINQAIEAGLPTYAECGGLMYLSESIHWQGTSADMVGIIPAEAHMHKKPRGRGYVKLEETAEMPWACSKTGKTIINAHINAHEFHYSELEKGISRLQDKGSFAYKVHRGVGITGEYDGWVYKNLLANYSHMRDTEQFHWASRFIDFVRNKKYSK